MLGSDPGGNRFPDKIPSPWELVGEARGNRGAEGSGSGLGRGTSGKACAAVLAGGR